MKKSIYLIVISLIVIPVILNAGIDETEAKTAQEDAVKDMNAAINILTATHELEKQAIDLMSKLQLGLTSSQEENKLKNDLLTDINKKIDFLQKSLRFDKKYLTQENAMTLRSYVATQLSRLIDIIDNNTWNWPGDPKRAQFQALRDILGSMHDDFMFTKKISGGSLKELAEKFEKTAKELKEKTEKESTAKKKK